MSKLKEPRQAVAYSRVSTMRQVEQGMSLEAQEAAIAAYCERRNLIVPTKTHTDAGISGRSVNNRAGLEAALDEVCECKGVLVVTSLSRLARSVIDACGILARLHECGGDLSILDLSIDTTSASGRMIFGLMAVLAEFESEQISERVRRGQAYAMETRGYLTQGVPPAGYRYEGNERIEVPEELEWLEELRSYLVGRTQAQALRKIIHDDFPTLASFRDGRENCWSQTVLRRQLLQSDKHWPVTELAEVE